MLLFRCRFRPILTLRFENILAKATVVQHLFAEKNLMTSTEKRKSKIFVSQKREQKLLVYVIVPDKCLSENLSIQEIDAFLLRIAAEVSYCILYGIILCFFPILSRCQILQLYNNMYKQRMRGQQIATNNTLKRKGTV